MSARRLALAAMLAALAAAVAITGRFRGGATGLAGLRDELWSSPAHPAPPGRSAGSRGEASSYLARLAAAVAPPTVTAPPAWRLPASTPAPILVRPLDRHPEPAAAPAQGVAAGPDALATAAAGQAAGLGAIRQLTFDGCCPGAWWAADGEALHFVDRPDGRLGIYGVPLWPPGAPAQIVDTEVAARAGGLRFRIRPAGGHSVVKDVETGLEWPLPTGGNPAHLAPDGSRVVWWESQGGRAQVDSLGRIFASGIDGQDPREIGGLWDAEVIGFLPGSTHALALGRPVRDDPTYLLVAIDTRSGAMREVARGLWLSDVILAPGGAWVVYMVSLDRQSPDANGVWVAPTDPAQGAPRKLDAFGAYRWRDGGRLLLVPMAPGTAHAVWQYDAASGARTLLVDPAVVPIRIANNDWSVSPDGSKLAFVAEEDRNIWVVELR